jgi:hypothetical protein
LLLAFAWALPARADPADIAAAGRGVVRVVLVANDGQSVQYVGHGSGFAVTPTLVVTNAHVVADAQNDEMMTIGVVPVRRFERVRRQDRRLLARATTSRCCGSSTRARSLPLALYRGAVEDGSECTQRAIPATSISPRG